VLRQYSQTAKIDAADLNGTDAPQDGQLAVVVVMLPEPVAVRDHR
jgi:hypothetical protein